MPDLNVRMTLAELASLNAHARRVGLNASSLVRSLVIRPAVDGQWLAPDAVPSPPEGTRSAMLNVRVTELERDALVRAAAAQGLGVSELVRRQVAATLAGVVNPNADSELGGE